MGDISGLDWMTAGAVVNSLGRMANNWRQMKQSGQMANQTMTITKNTASCWKEQNGRTGTARRKKGSLVRSHLRISKVFLLINCFNFSSERTNYYYLFVALVIIEETLTKHLRKKISEKSLTQRFDVSMASFSSEKNKI